MIHEVLARPAPASAPAASGALAIRDLHKSFTIGGATRTVLEAINLDIRPGEFVSIVGASGCGKSTLLRLIVGLDQDYRGEIRLDGERVSTTSLDRGIVFQDHRLFPWMTLEQNIELALLNTDVPKARRAQIVAEHIALVNLTGFEKAYPHQLSGGMAQRVALARALVNDPQLLVLDEPLGKLDSLTRIAMQSELVNLWQRAGFSALLVTHDVEEALFLANRVIVLSDRPARVAAEIVVDLPYPRHRGHARLAELRHEALRHLGLDATW